MSITPGRLGLLLAAMGVFVIPFQTTAEIRSADRLRDEGATRRQFVLELIPRIVREDDRLVTSGLDDRVRQRRINRIFGMGEKIFSAGYESTAVAAACFDALRLDPTLSGSPLAGDLAKAVDYLVQSLLPLIPGEDFQAAGQWQALRKRAQFDPRDAFRDHELDRAFGSTPSPLVSSVRTVPLKPVLLETPGREIATGAAMFKGFAWIPGSHLIATWGDSGVRIIDADKPESSKLMSPAPGYFSLVVSESGEYLACARHDPSLPEDVLELYRLLGDSAAVVLDRGRITNLRFSPRRLRLAYWKDRSLLVRDLEVPGEPMRIESVFDIADGRLEWSPDGRYLMAHVTTTAMKEQPPVPSGRPPVTRLIYDVEQKKIVSRGERVPAWASVWAPDSRTFAVLDTEGEKKRVRLSGIDTDADSGAIVQALENRPPIYPVPSGGEAMQGAWSLKGTFLALRVIPVVSRDDDSPARREATFPATPTLPAPADPSDFADWLSAFTVVPTPPPASPVLDPPASTIGDFAWHPSGEWYAGTQFSHLFGPFLWLRHAATGADFPVGRAGAGMPRFSSDGRRLAYVDVIPWRSLMIQDLEPGRAAALAKQETATADKARAERKAVATVRHYRNALRLDPFDVQARQGLGNAYLMLAGSMTDPWQEGYFLEGAARELLVAYELASRRPNVRVDFLDVMARRALFMGRRRAAEFSALAEKRLGELPETGYTRIDGLEQAARDLQDAILWDPWNEHHLALLEGIFVRLDQGTGRKPGGSGGKPGTGGGK